MVEMASICDAPESSVNRFAIINALSRSRKNSVVVGLNVMTRNATLKAERTKEPK